MQNILLKYLRYCEYTLDTVNVFKNLHKDKIYY